MPGFGGAQDFRFGGGAFGNPLLDVGIGLLAASGPSRLPVTLGSALGQGLSFAQESSLRRSEADLRRFETLARIDEIRARREERELERSEEARRQQQVQALIENLDLTPDEKAILSITPANALNNVLPGLLASAREQRQRTAQDEQFEAFVVTQPLEVQDELRAAYMFNRGEAMSGITENLLEQAFGTGGGAFEIGSFDPSDYTSQSLANFVAGGMRDPSVLEFRKDASGEGGNVPKIGAIDADKFTVESLAEFQRTGDVSKLVPVEEGLDVSNINPGVGNMVIQDENGQLKVVPIPGISEATAQREEEERRVTAQRESREIINLVDQLEAVSGLGTKESIFSQSIGGRLSNLAIRPLGQALQSEAIGQGASVDEYVKLSQGVTSIIAKSVQEEKGVLTEKDAGRALALMPGPSDLEDVAQRKFARLRQFILNGLGGPGAITAKKIQSMSAEEIAAVDTDTLPLTLKLTLLRRAKELKGE